MADIITRFKLETTQYDSKLRDASKELAEYTRKATQAGNEFGRFTQKNIEAARALGNITPSASNAKDKVKELVGAFNDAAKAYNALTKEQQQSDFGKALSSSLTQLQQRIHDTKQEMQGLNDTLKGSGGGDSLRGMLEVFGGNMMTKAVELIGKLSDEVVQVLNESSRLSIEAEGIQIAFERLGRGDLLEGLREATHNTVSDLELMKAAVKFNDFKLSLDELGTMLAFAQQKAKDTGQSVDYMVDSIVTGLGRQSLMILDNLGLSASEVKEKMKETGDMTKAVGAIIRQQMSEAGEYVVTASDKATQAQVELQNAMLELGNSMRETFGYTGWADMAAGIKTELVGAIQFTIDTINEAKKAWRELKALMTGGGNAKGDVNEVAESMGARSSYTETRDSKGNLVKATRNGKDVTKEVLEHEGVTITARRPTAPKTKTPRVGRGGGGGTTTTTTITYAADSIAAQEALVADLTKKWKEAGAAVRDDYLKQLNEAQWKLDDMKNPQSRPMLAAPTDIMSALAGKGVEEKVTVPQEALDKIAEEVAKAMAGPEGTPLNEVMGEMASGMSQVVNGMEQLGIDIPDGIKSAIGAIQGISTILTGIATTLIAIETLSAADTLIPFARGGIIPRAAGGYFVGGRNFSSDITPIMANAGELVLNRAQQGVLAQQLSNNHLSNMHLSASLTGETITLAVNAHNRRVGRGEVATTRNRRYGNMDS